MLIKYTIEDIKLGRALYDPNSDDEYILGYLPSEDVKVAKGEKTVTDERYLLISLCDGQSLGPHTKSSLCDLLDRMKLLPAEVRTPKRASAK